MNPITQLRIEAGPHQRRDCPLCCAAPAGLDLQRSYVLQDPKGRRLPVQILTADRPAAELFFVLPFLPAQQSRTYNLIPGSRPRRKSLEFQDCGDTLEVLLGGKLFTALHTGKQWIRPFLYPLIGPTGSSLTRSWPIAEGPADQSTDPPHQKSFWTAWGDLNGCNHWTDSPKGHGSIRCRQREIISAGPLQGQIRLQLDWLNEQGDRQLAECRELTFYQLPGQNSLLDLRLTFSAQDGDVTFADTKEGGLCSIRVACALEGVRGGSIVNGYGARGEEETWGKRAPWCDYSGLLPDGAAGICIMDHPDNYRYPTYWHVRDYGLMTANPFGLSHFYRDQSRNGSMLLKSGQQCTFRYRLYCHRGDARSGAVAERYLDYLYPPKITLGS